MLLEKKNLVQHDKNIFCKTRTEKVLRAPRKAFVPQVCLYAVTIWFIFPQPT